MSNGIVTSRRNFLKLFGAAAVVAAVPIPLVLAEQVVAPVQRGLPPNVLHLKDGGVWKAISELQSTRQNYELAIVYTPFGVPHKFKGARNAGELEIVGSRTPELVHLDNVLRADKPARFAISVQGQVYEFDALMMQLAESYGLDNAPDFKATLGMVGEVETYLFEE